MIKEFFNMKKIQNYIWKQEKDCKISKVQWEWNYIKFNNQKHFQNNINF